jgi:hypothetical protein
VVVFFDEFQELASGRFGDPDIVTKQLRAELQRARSVSTLFAGSVEHVMRDLFAPSERALSQFGSQYDLAPITREEWREGLAARFERSHMTAATSAVDRLIDAAEGQPRTTMLLA